MELIEKLTYFTENIIETVPPEQVLYIFCIGFIWCTFYNFIGNIYIGIENKIWLVKNYEEIIHDYITVDEAISFKDKKLIAHAKENVQKKYARRRKLKSLFSKKRKSDK